MSKRGNIYIRAVLALLCFALAFFAVGCGSPRVYTVEDPLNEKGMSYWSQLPFITAEAKAAGYYGSDACQHLNSISRSKTDKNIMFFGTDAAGVWKSTDGGKRWFPRNKGLYTSGSCRTEIDPVNKNHVITVNTSGSQGTSRYSGIYYSDDCGDSWTKSTVATNNDGSKTSIGFAAPQYYYDCLEIDESTYDRAAGYCRDVYFCTPCERDDWASSVNADDAFKPNKGMYKSTDGGKSFARVAGSEALTDGIIVIVGGKVAVANMNGIFTVGDTVKQVSDKNVYSFVYAGGRYYVQCEDGIYTSDDLAAYKKIESDSYPGGDRRPRNLAVSEKDPMHMVMFARRRAANKYSNRPYYSNDGGATWKEGELNENPELFYYYTYHAGTYTFDPDSADIIVGIIGGEVIRSEDGGKSFTYSGSGISDISVGGQFHFNIYDENLMYTGAYDFGGALTTDGGKTWKDIRLSKDGDGRDIMGGYAADENTVFGAYVDTWSPGDYFANYRYVCYTHDGGKTVNIDPSKVIKASEYKNTDKTDVYADLKIDSAISTSCESSYQSPNNRKVLFCCNYRSEDNGYTWENMQNAASGEKCLQVYTHSGKTLYGCSKKSGFVLKSDDDGKTWQKVNTTELETWMIWDGGKMRPVTAPSHITDIAVDGKNGYIYAAFSKRLYRMKLDGSEIVNCSEGMAKNNFNTLNVRSVDIDKNCPEIVYVCGSGDFYMDCESVRRSCDFGATWYTMTPSGSESSIVNDNSSLGFEGRCIRTRKDGTVWLGTLCLGFCTLTPPYKI